MNNYSEISALMTLGDFLCYWFDTFVLRTVKQSTAISYSGYIKNHIVPRIGEVRLCDLNINILQTFFNDICDNGRVSGGSLSPKTLHNIRLMFHRALNKAVDLELIPRNYTEGLELPKLVVPKMRVLTQPEQVKVLAVLRTSDEKLAFGVYLSLTTGMRLGEILGLKWKDIDMEYNMVYVTRTVNRLSTLNGRTKTELVVGTPKSSHSVRGIPFNEKLNAEFAAYKERSAVWLKAVPSEEDFVVSLRKGKPTDPKTMQDTFKRITKRAEIAPANFHALRHRNPMKKCLFDYLEFFNRNVISAVFIKPFGAV